MFLTDRKLERRISEIEQYRYRDIIELKSFLAAEDNQGVVNPKLPTFTECKTLEVGQTWKGRDKFLWLHKDIHIPSEWNGKKVICIFYFVNYEAVINSDFYFFILVNVKIIYGVVLN